MKLIDILVRDISKHGGWPHGVDNITQYSTGELCFNSIGGGCIESCTGIFLEPHEDGYPDWAFGTKVTREQYEAALAASKPEWDGEGLPPVGCRVEVKADDFEGGWLVIDVVYVHNGEVVGIVQSENEYLNDRLEKFSAGYNRAEFRPIRPEEDRRRDASIQEMIELIDSLVGERANPVHGKKSVAEKFYDAIAAGKIPHICID